MGRRVVGGRARWSLVAGSDKGCGGRGRGVRGVEEAVSKDGREARMSRPDIKPCKLHDSLIA